MTDNTIKWLFNALLCLGMACFSLIKNNPDLLDSAEDKPKIKTQDVDFEEIKE